MVCAKQEQFLVAPPLHERKGGGSLPGGFELIGLPVSIDGVGGSEVLWKLRHQRKLTAWGGNGLRLIRKRGSEICRIIYCLYR